MSEEKALKVPDELSTALVEAQSALAHADLRQALADVFRAKKANENVKRATLKTIEDYEEHGEWLRALKEEALAVEQRRVVTSGPIYSVWKLVNGFLSKPNELNQETIGIINKRLTQFEEARAREQREREEELRRLQAEEKKRIEAEAEKQARAAEKAGDAELAREIRENVPAPAPIVLMPRTAPPIEGIARRETWRCVVDDVEKLPPEYWEKVPKQKLLDALAKDNKGKNPPPGCHFEKDVVRGRKS